MGNLWIGPFGVGETRRRIQKQGGHCLSQASLPAAECGEQRRHLQNHAEGQWFWVLLPKQKDLGRPAEPRHKTLMNNLVISYSFSSNNLIRDRLKPSTSWL